MRDPNNKINLALFKFLCQLARLLLRFGIGYREYCELSRAAFVAVAADDYGVHGRQTNASRIAAMTGLTRKEISRVRRAIKDGAATETSRLTPLREVLAAWQTAAEFVDDKGRARELPLDGKRGSFQSLVRRFAGDIPQGAMRKELERIGAAEVDGDRLRLIPTDPSEMAARNSKVDEVLATAESQLAALVGRVNP
jgi:hypothetical protein